MKRIFGILLVVSMVISIQSPVFAVDKRVKASKTWVTTKDITAKEAKAHKYWKKGYLKGNGKGYVTANQKHGVSVKLYAYYTNNCWKYSGRKWGTGKVSNSTGWATNNCCLLDEYFSAVYYKF